MTQTGTALALTAGGVLLYNVLAKSTSLGRLNFYPESIRGVAMDGATPVLSIGLAIQNTSNQKMVLRSFAANLFSSDKLVGNISSFQPLEILPNTQGVLVLQARMSLLGIVNELIRAIQYGTGGEYTIELDGFANVDRYQIPVKLSYKFGTA